MHVLKTPDNSAFRVVNAILRKPVIASLFNSYQGGKSSSRNSSWVSTTMPTSNFPTSKDHVRWKVYVLSAVCSKLQKKRGSVGAGKEEPWNKVERLKLLTQQLIFVAHTLSPEKGSWKDRTPFDVCVKVYFAGHRAKKIFRPAFVSYEMADFRSNLIVSQKISWLSRQVLCVVLYEHIFLLSAINHDMDMAYSNV